MKKILSFLFCILAPLLMSAQLPMMDITLVPVGGQYELRLRPDNGDYQGVFSSIVFTVQWNGAPEVPFGGFIPSTESLSYGISPALSGEVVTTGGNTYAVFAGFGLQTISPNWVAGEEIVMGVFPDNGYEDFGLADDAWTAANNADYFISLNGVDRTGIIYGDLTTGIEEVFVSRELCTTIYPNPTEGTMKVVVDLPHGGLLFIRVVNTKGETIHSSAVPTAEGISTHDIDMSAFASGQYFIETRMGDMRSSLPCIVQR